DRPADGPCRSRMGRRRTSQTWDGSNAYSASLEASASMIPAKALSVDEIAADPAIALHDDLPAPNPLRGNVAENRGVVGADIVERENDIADLQPHGFGGRAGSNTGDQNALAVIGQALLFA